MAEAVTHPSRPSAVAHGDAAMGLAAASLSPMRMAARRFARHKGALVCAVLLAVMVAFVALSPLTARYGVNEAVFEQTAARSNVNLSPRSAAWFGTDSIGRDLYSRLIYGLRLSMIIGLASAVISTIVGVAVGAAAGYVGGRFDDVVMRVTDVFLAFPFLVALLVVRGVLGAIGWLEPVVGEPTSVRFVVALFALFGWMTVARIVRGQVLALKEREFVEAARALGASGWRIVTRHLLPNTIGPILVALSTAVVAAIVGESTLSFFGFGPQPGAGQTSLGNLVAGATAATTSGYWWLAVFPCAGLVLLTLCVMFVGDGVRDATDPRLSARGRR